MTVLQSVQPANALESGLWDLFTESSASHWKQLRLERALEGPYTQNQHAFKP